MIVDAGWDCVHLNWLRHDGVLEVFVGSWSEGLHGTYRAQQTFRAVWTTQDVVAVVADVLQNEQLQLPT